MQYKAYHGFLLFFVCFLTSCSSLLYYPSRQLFFPPEKLGYHPEEVFFPSKTGDKLFGWYFQTTKKPAKATIVFYHGNGENMSSHYISVVWLLEHGFNLFTFDYQGYGRSEGEPSPQGTLKDGEAALQWVSQKTNLPIIILGQSLGGAIALRNSIDLKDKFPIKLVAVDSTFLSYQKAGRYILKKSWLTWPFQWLSWLALSDKYAPLDVQKISPIPLLVIHGNKDQIIDFELGEEVFKKAAYPKEFWGIENGEHTDVFMKKDISYRRKFIEKIEASLK